MNKIALVQIIGTPLACANGSNEPWREVAIWIKHKMVERFGDQVEVEYYDIFDSTCPLFPKCALIPVVIINGIMISNGGKISESSIRKSLESFFEISNEANQ